jgi:L-fuculose-phosphate aldolase
MDLRKRMVITESDLAQATREGFQEALVSEQVLLTLSACEYLRRHPLRLVCGKADIADDETSALKLEIIKVGRKLWERQYVDGSGGNISARSSPHQVICTPSFCCKGDLTLDDFAIVDLDGTQVSGAKPRSSEIMLHLEIYRAVPGAHAVIHCHPPHAMAYAITGRIPPGGMVPEYEVFVGKVALAPYETPGSPEFARSVLPYVRERNVILLENHGIVCWAETVTQAEWTVEIFETYCRTVILASHSGAGLVPIPERKTKELLEIRKKFGLPIDSL